MIRYTSIYKKNYDENGGGGLSQLGFGAKLGRGRGVHVMKWVWSNKKASVLLTTGLPQYDLKTFFFFFFPVISIRV